MIDTFYYHKCCKCKAEFESNEEEVKCLNCKSQDCLIIKKCYE